MDDVCGISDKILHVGGHTDAINTKDGYNIGFLDVGKMN